MPPAEPRGAFGSGGPSQAPSAAFGARPRSAADLVRRLRALVVLLLLVSSGLVLRGLWQARAPAAPGMLVEVQGAVPDPGIYELPEGATVRDAFLAAGAVSGAITDPFVDLPVHHGYRVLLLPGGAARVWLAEDRLLVGLPVDPNTADSLLLQQLPGIGPSKALAIIEDRRARGPFGSVDELVRVSGIGQHTVDRLRPYLGIDGIEGPEPVPLAPGQEAAP